VEIPPAVEPDPVRPGAHRDGHHGRGNRRPGGGDAGCGRRKAGRGFGFRAGKTGIFAARLRAAALIEASITGGNAMSVLKKLAAAAAITAAMFVAPASAQDMKIALVVKSLGNGFFDAANKGAQEAAEEIGGIELIYTGPTQ